MASSPLQKLEEIEKTCRVCGNSTSMRCSRCHIVYYCSKEHIALDWKKHKPGCNATSVATPSQGNAKGRKTLQAILLPVNEDTPRLIDVISQTEHDPMNITFYHLETEHLYPKMSSVRPLPIDSMGINGPMLKSNRCIALIYDDNGLINGSPFNRCVQRLTNGKAVHPWPGNLLVLRLHPRDLVATKYRNANMNEDIEPIRRFLEDYLTVRPNFD